MGAVHPLRRPGQEPPAPKPARVRRAKAPPSPYVSFSPEFLALMASLGLSHSQAQRCVTGSFGTRAAADQMRGLLRAIAKQAREAERRLP